MQKTAGARPVGSFLERPLAAIVICGCHDSLSSSPKPPSAKIVKPVTCRTAGAPRERTNCARGDLIESRGI
jgi:hypothetical protein